MPAAAFRAGSLVVLRVGDGAEPLSASVTTAAYIDEYDVTFSALQPPLRQALQLPASPSDLGVAAGQPLITVLGGDASVFLSRSADGRAVTLAGVDAPRLTPLSSLDADVGRVAASVSFAGAIDTTARSLYASGDSTGATGEPVQAGSSSTGPAGC